MSGLGCATLLASANLAWAQQSLGSGSGLYVAGGLGYVAPGSDKQTLDNALNSAGAYGFSSSLNPAAYARGALGVQLSRNLALEAAFFGSGNESYSASGGNLTSGISATASVTGYSFTAVGLLPLSPEFSIVGRIGVASTNLKLNVSTTGYAYDVSATRTGLTAGIGTRWDMPTRIFLTVDVDSYQTGDDTTGKGHATLVGVGLGYRF
jgi:opacity protein-like surface antigen